MAYLNFVLPASKKDLLNTSAHYYVKYLVSTKEIVDELKKSRQALRDEGAEYIVDAFPTYYSVIHSESTLPMDVIYSAYEDLHKATTELNRALGFLLEDKNSLDDETKLKFSNILKMLVYIYVQTVVVLEDKNEKKRQNVLTKRKKSKDDEQYVVDKKRTVVLLNNIFQREINLFWDPPVVEESFVNVAAEAGYRFLQVPDVKGNKEAAGELFNFLGTLITAYNHGITFVTRMVELVKHHEHTVQCVPDGVRQLAVDFNCKGLVHELVKELTEWQTDEQYQDSQGARHCAMLLSSMAVLMPDLMIPELRYLNTYLHHNSATLRNSVLSVVTEVIAKALTGHGLSEEQKQCRDDLFAILLEHTRDVSAQVRAKVMQHWARLQKEAAIPLRMQHDVLCEIVERLSDKGALVRKWAANCVTAFLTHNAFSANLSLSEMQRELEGKKKLLDDKKAQFEDLKTRKMLELENLWDAKSAGLKAVIEEQLKKEKETSEENVESNEEDGLPSEEILEIIRLYLNEDKYEEAYKLCKLAANQIEEFREIRDNNQPHEADFYLIILCSIFVNADAMGEELRSGRTRCEMTSQDFRDLEGLETTVEYLGDCVAFLKVIDGVIGTMIELLDTTAIGDMHEAIEFFVSAYQFNVDNASRGILAMLELMKRSEQERKKCVMKGFQTVYLNTDAKSMEEHSVTIVDRLVRLVRTLPADNYADLEEIVAEWTTQGTLDNSVVDVLWQRTTRRSPAADGDDVAAATLLRMCARGRRTIVTRNVKTVAALAFGQRGADDMLLLEAACLLAASAGERVDPEAAEPPFRLNHADEDFARLVAILSEKFFEPVGYYGKAMFAALDFIYNMCSKPERPVEDFLANVVNRLASECKQRSRDGKKAEFDVYILVRVCQLFGYVALKQLNHLDDTVYRELRRRGNVRYEREQAKKSKKRAPKAKPSRLSTSATAANTSMAEESMLEGALAEDTDAEFILNVLENQTVSGSGALAKMESLIKGICKRPDVYDDVMLQGAAVMALSRYMLVSSKFCEQNVQLLFTILEKTAYPEVKCSILVQVSDLLRRFPNVIEPWTPRIYQRLRDPLTLVRQATFFTLAELVLSDMIRVHSHISEMACRMVDEDEGIRRLCKTFFAELSRKETGLYSTLPDIFSHLVEADSISDEQMREIMRFLFGLVSDTKHVGNLVDRFCGKFKLTEDADQHRAIAYCLTLIQYNDKALKNLIENFPTYKHLVHDPEIYGHMKAVMQSCNRQQQQGKKDLKELVAELEKSIRSVFEVREDGEAMAPPPVPQPRKKKTKKKSTRRKRDSDSEEEDDDGEGAEESVAGTPSTRPNRRRRQK